MHINNIFLLGAFALIAGEIPVQTTYTLSREYTVTIKGTSTIRNWQETVGKVSGNIMAGLNEDGSVELTMIRIKMSVYSIKSDMGAGMDKKTFESLKGKDYPDITFLVNTPAKFSQLKPGAGVHPVTGTMSLAGVCKPITMYINSFILIGGRMQFEGFQHVNMMDFGVRPPTALFGTIKADPRITIYFKANFINQTKANFSFTD